MTAYEDNLQYSTLNNIIELNKSIIQLLFIVNMYNSFSTTNCSKYNESSGTDK